MGYVILLCVIAVLETRGDLLLLCRVYWSSANRCTEHRVYPTQIFGRSEKLISYGKVSRGELSPVHTLVIILCKKSFL